MKEFSEINIEMIFQTVYDIPVSRKMMKKRDLFYYYFFR